MAAQYPIYLDYNATTPLAPEVAAAMKDAIDTKWGNPSSSHVYGTQARAVIDASRAHIATMLGAKPNEIIFTSGGSESNNWAIKGIAYQRRAQGNHIITSAVEHPSVLEVLKFLEGDGFRVTRVGVDSEGRLLLDELKAAITPETILITVMHANNEVGTLQPIAEIRAIADRARIALHTDASQSIGKVRVKVDELGCDLLTVCGHKLYAPKGVGALYIREGIQLQKFMHGANHEHGWRAGTENTVLVAGLGTACQLIEQYLEEYMTSMHARREQLRAELTARCPDVRVNGHPSARIPNTLSISFPSVLSYELLSLIRDEVAASGGAACHSNVVSISAVLAAMKVPEEFARGTVRLSVGRHTTPDEITRAVNVIVSGVERLVAPARCRLEVRPRLGEFSASLVPLDEVTAFYRVAHVPLPADVPYVWSNTVQTLDGVISMREPGQQGAGEISMRHIKGSGSEADWRMLNAGWAHADAVMLSGEVVRREAAHFDFDCTPRYEDLRQLRAQLGLAPHPLLVIITGAGMLDWSLPAFTSGRPVLVITTERAGEVLAAVGAAPPNVTVRCLPAAEPNRVDLAACLRMLRAEFNVKYLDLSAGGKVIAAFVAHKLLHELRLTTSGMLLGGTSTLGEARPIALPLSEPGRPAYTADTAPLLVHEGVRLSGDYLMFLRTRLVYRH